jgi:hypothetical protein
LAIIDADSFASSAYAVLQQLTDYSGLEEHERDPRDAAAINKLTVIVGAVQQAVQNAHMLQMGPAPTPLAPPPEPMLVRPDPPVPLPPGRVA